MIDDDTLEVTVDQLLADEGTVVVFSGTTEAGEHITFAVEHRMAGPIAAAITFDEEATAMVAPWQILSSTS